MYSQSSAKMYNSRVSSNVVSKHGAGIRVEDRADLALVSTEVSHNVANLGGGGAHVTTGSLLSVRGGKFENNTAPNGAAFMCEGGAHGGGEIVGSGVSVKSNVASGLGGAMYLAGACDVQVKDASEIESNSAVSGSSCRSLYAVGGGAFALVPNTENAPTKLAIEGSTIVRRNTAPTGGAIFVIPASTSADVNSPRGAQITVTSSTLSNNEANGCGSTVPGRGGAMFVAAGNHTLLQASLSENTADKDGGAVFIAHAVSKADQASALGSTDEMELNLFSLVLERVANLSIERQYPKVLMANACTVRTKTSSVNLHSSRSASLFRTNRGGRDKASTPAVIILFPDMCET